MLTKKWLFVGIFTLLGLSLAMAAPPAVHPTTGEPLVITCLKGTPETIDGNLSDWNLEAMTPAVLDVTGQLFTGQASWTNAADCSGKFYLLWDDKNIYMAVVVKDDKISMTKSGVDIWNADCIEVFFGTTNAVAGHAEHYQWGFNANNQKFNWCNMDSAGQAVPDYLEVASSRTPDGYICEVAIPYARMSALKFTPGNAIGFHPVLDDTEATDREIQMTWTSREAHDQSLGFGHLILSSDPALAKELSRRPSPANKAADVPVDAILSWTAGQFAASHDVYFGTVFADVNTAARTNVKGVLASKGQAGATFDPPGMLTYGQTYYWRVDEVNAAPSNTIFKGEVWSFTAESYGYPVKPTAATASSAQLNMGPEKTIDGSGLDKSDLHGVDGTTMWLSTPAPSSWIQYQFDKVYKLYDLTVWNSNGPIESFMGFGAKKVTIEYSDGTTWKAVDNVPEFARAPGMISYAANTKVRLGNIQAQYVKLTITSTWGGVGVAGLSEVRFSTPLVKAFGPQPANAATGVSVEASLDWRPGREASSHKVFFGTDQAAVAGGTVAAKTVTTHSLTPSGLNFGTTYYWKVDEVNTVTYPGDLWSFTTQEYAVVEDFESYTDKADNEVFSSWIDGFADNYKSSGSTVGLNQAKNGTFCETTIIHGGRQSMPLEYNNAKTPFYSEAQRTFDTPQDWTTSGADTLALYFRGVAPPSNGPAPLYVVVEDKAGKSKTVVHPNPSASTTAAWTEWRIPLSTLTGISLTTVKKITIGVGDKASPKAGAAGMLYLDDISFGHPVK